MNGIRASLPEVTRSLVERWENVLEQRSGDVAVWGISNGKLAGTTFEELDRHAWELTADIDPGRAAVGVCASEPLGGFVAGVLAAWRMGRAVELLEHPESNFAANDLWPEDLSVALVKRTSGSTGVPRRLLFTGEQVMADVDQLMPTMGLSRRAINLAVISPAHSYGFSNLVTPLLFQGMSALAPAGLLPAAVNQAVIALAARLGKDLRLVIPGVPALWRAWVGGDAIDPALIELAISAGAPLPLELEHLAWARQGIKIHNFYGASECGGIAYDRSGTPRSTACLAGTPVQGVRVELDHCGRVSLTSRACAIGLWHNGSLDPAGGVGQGRFVTTDLARLTDDGELLLSGRADDLINLAGRKVHPDTVEHQLRALPEVAECVVFGIKAGDPTRVHEMVACVRPFEHPGQDALLNRIRNHLEARLPSWQMPRHWEITPDLRADRRGKISRHQWRLRFIERQQDCS